MQPISSLQRAGALSIERLDSSWHGILDKLALLEQQPALALRFVAGAWLVTRAVLFAGMLLAHSYCDPAFYKYAGLFAAGQWPYHSVPVEYPPLAMLLILMPALPLLPFASIAPRPDPAFVANPLALPQPNPVRYAAYGISFAVMMLAIDLLSLWLVMRAARRLLPGDPLGLRSAILYIGLVFLTGALLQKFELAAGALCLAAVLALVTERYALAGAVLGLATLVKGFPALALPIFAAIVVVSAGQGPTLAALKVRAPPLRSLIGAFALVVGGVTLLVALWAGIGPLWHTVTYHTGRGTEIESLYGNVLLLVSWLPGLRATTAFSGADLSRVVLSPLNGAMGALAALALLVGVALAYLATWRALRRSGWPGDRDDLPRLAAIATLAALLAFEVTFRALPAHYLLDAVPLAVLVRLPDRRWARWWVVALLGITLVSQVIISTWHALVIELQPWSVALLTIRSACWVLAVAALLASLWRWPRSAQSSGARSPDVPRSPPMEEFR
jgi:hypothetical protein